MLGQVRLRLIIPGKPPSVNHMYHAIRGRAGNTVLIHNDEAKMWFAQVGLLAREWKWRAGWRMPEPKQKVLVHVWYYFENDTRPDPSNCLKLLLDALQGVIYPNDKWVLAREENYSFDKENPRIELNFEVMEG